MEQIIKKILFMIELTDFTNCPLSPRNLEYAGRAGKKEGLFIKMVSGF